MKTGETLMKPPTSRMTSSAKKLRWAAALASAALALTACSGAQNNSTGNGGGGGDLKLGLLIPYTGEYSWIGENVEEAVKLILDEQVNASGGIDGKDVTFVRGDTEGTVDSGVLAARKLTDTDQVLGFVGPTSLSFTGVRQVVVDTMTPVITPTAGTVEFDTAGTSFFHRTVPSDSLGGRAIVKAITESEDLLDGKSFDKVALMVGDAPALVSFEKPITSAMKEFGLPLSSSMHFSVSRQSYRSEVAQVLRDDPDMIVLVGAPADSASIMRQAKQSGYDGSWFVTQDQTNADYVKLAGAKVVEGVYGLEEAASEDAAGLRKTFSAALGHEPKIFQTNSYDAINVMTLAMYQAAKTDHEVTRATIEKRIDEVANPEQGDVVVTSFEDGKKAIDNGDGIDYQGLSGPVDFDDYGSITSPFQILQVKGGAFAPVAVLDAESLK